MEPWAHISAKFESKYTDILSRRDIWKCRLQSGDHFPEGSLCKHGWPSTPPNRITHNLQHTTELHTTQWLGGVLDRLCAICPNSSAGWPNIDPTAVLSPRRWANVSPTYNAVWLVRLCRGLPIRVTHTNEPARHRAAELCAVRWCAARLCINRLGCVVGHPGWSRWENNQQDQVYRYCCANMPEYGHSLWPNGFIVI